MTTQYQAGKPHRGVYHAYIRVSTDKQDIARQQDMIRKHLNGGKHEVKYYIDEGYSGDLPPDQREGLKQCLRDAETNRRKGGKGNRSRSTWAEIDAVAARRAYGESTDADVIAAIPVG